MALMFGDLPNESAIGYHFGPYRIDGRLRRLFKDGEPVVLTPKAADTLIALVERAGRVVEKDELLRVVWDEVFVGEDTLAQNISTLRRVLADDPNSPQFIATVPRRGYKFVAAVRAVPSQDANGTPPALPSARRAGGGLVALAGATALAAAIGGLAVYSVSVRSPPRAAVQFTIAEPESGRFAGSGGMLALSPDGGYLVFVAIAENGSASLWLRPLASTVARRLDGTDGAANPFWSPDSRTIAFFAGRRLKALDVASGAVRVVAALSSPRSLGGTWSRQGQILFSVPGEGMYLVAATGGSPRRLAPALDPKCEDCATWPHFLPDGQHFLYTVTSSDTSGSGIYVGEMGKPGGQLLLDAVSSSSYVAPGHLFYGRSGMLYLQPFDMVHLRVTGTPVPLADGVAYNARTGRVMAAISEAGSLAFREAFITELVWMDRAGRPQGVAAPPGRYHAFSIAPDGQRVAAARVDARSGATDIWVFDGGREVRMTDDPGRDGEPVWSEDGRYVVYGSTRAGRWQIYRREATTVGPEELLLDSDAPVTPLQILPSTHVIYGARRAKLPFEVWKLGRGESRPLAHIEGIYPAQTQASPDGRWLAFARPETTAGVSNGTLYVSGLPFVATHRAIAEAASHPRWRGDGRELFYLSNDSTVVSIPVDPQRTPSDSAGGALFRTSGVPPTGVSGQVYDVTSDGQRFLVKREVGSSPIHVALNWDARLP